jgi:hypothetical protein
MKNIILAAVAAFAFIAPTFAAEGAAAVAEKTNANCVCGHAADAKVEAVSVKVGEADKKIAVCSKECAEAVKKMDPKEAWKAVEAHNKAGATVK